MLDSTFRHQFKQAKAVVIAEGFILFRKPCELYCMNDDTSVLFKNLDEAFEYEINGVKIRDIIASAGLNDFKIPLEGGSGAGSPKGNQQEFKFGNAPQSGNGEDKTRYDLPARLNTRIKVKTEEEAIKQFRKLHANDNYESGAVIDENGYAYQYKHGNATSIGIWGEKNQLVLHNHPSGGNFSKADMLSVATSAERGIVASGKYGDYIFKKGTHFNASKFTKAVNNARMMGTDYDDAVDKWLKKNQKKYGYSYEFRKAKADKKTRTTTPKIKWGADGQGSLF